MKREAGEGVWALWLSLGRAVWNGDGGWCVGVARWHVPGGGNGGVVRSRITRQGGGAWAETRNRAVMARFRAHHVEGRWGTVRGGGAVARTRWWLGRAVAKHEEGRGVWVKNPKPSCRGSVSGCNGAAGSGGGCCGVTDTPSRANLWVGMGS